MEKGKGVMGGGGRRWAVDFTDNSSSHSSRDVPDPPGFSRASSDQVFPFLSHLFSLTLHSIPFHSGPTSPLSSHSHSHSQQDDSSLTRQKKDAESTWKAQVTPHHTTPHTSSYFLLDFNYGPHLRKHQKHPNFMPLTHKCFLFSPQFSVIVFNYACIVSLIHWIGISSNLDLDL